MKWPEDALIALCILNVMAANNNWFNIQKEKYAASLMCLLTLVLTLMDKREDFGQLILVIVLVSCGIQVVTWILI